MAKQSLHTKTDSKKYFIRMLLQSGCSVTRQRLLVLSFLHSQQNPVDIKTIARQLPKNEINQVTIYRILTLFKKQGLVNQIDLQDDRAYFELMDKQDHHHIICIQCKKIKDFSGCDHRKIAEKLKRKNNDFAKITNHSFEFFGICRACI